MSAEVERIRAAHRDIDSAINEGAKEDACFELADACNPAAMTAVLEFIDSQQELIDKLHAQTADTVASWGAKCAALAQQSARHAEELAAYELTVGNLREQAQPTKTQVLAITTAYEQGVGKGHQAHQRKAEIENPYAESWGCREAWRLGYAEGKEQAERTAPQAQPVADVDDILRAVCETDPADFGDRRNICISPKDLKRILRDAKRHREELVAYEVTVGKPREQTERKPMPEDQLEELYREHSGYSGTDFNSFARAVEAFHGIKEQL